ncbi:MAG: hypothetical protein ABJL18_05385 [Hyphomicrobiales bacterium]
MTLAARRSVLVLFVLAKLFITAGMATASPLSGGLSEAEKAAYMLPDGTIPVICLTFTGEGDGGSHLMCDGCCSSCKGMLGRSGAHGDIAYLTKLAFLGHDNITPQENDLASHARGPPIA